MVVKDGKTYYWCDKHKYPLSGVQGMYVFHKPTDHDVWLERKTALNGRHGGKRESYNSRLHFNSQAIFDTGRSKIIPCKVSLGSFDDDYWSH
jgi:hypothetical protein